MYYTSSEIDDRGAFVRQPNRFRAPFGDKEGELKAEKGRYRLFWAKGCHWSNRASIVRELLGLEDAISVQIVTSTGQSNKYGWGFEDQPNHEDSVTKAKIYLCGCGNDSTGENLRRKGFQIF